MQPSVEPSVPESSTGIIDERRLMLRAERAAAAPYWGGFQTRIVVTFAAFTFAWVAVIVLGASGALPLWLGLVLATVLASTFYMPMHEATHGNIAGKQSRLRPLEDAIGTFCSIPLGISYGAHRSSHMRHHAYTNDPDRDPDHFTDGPLRKLPPKLLAIVTLSSLLPVFAFVPAARKLLPAQLRRSMQADDDRSGGLQQLRFWVVMHLVLLVAFLAGHTHKQITNEYKGIQLVNGETTSRNNDKRPMGFRLWNVNGNRELNHEFVELEGMPEKQKKSK